MSDHRIRYYERWANMEQSVHTLRTVCMLLAVALVGSVALNLSLAGRRQIVVGVGPTGERRPLPQTDTDSGEKQFVHSVLLTLYDWDSANYETAYRSAAELMTSSLSAKLLESLNESTRRGIEQDGVTCRLVIDNSEKGTDGWAVTGIKTLRGHTLSLRQRVEFSVEVDRGPVTETNPWGMRVSSLSEREVGP